MLIKDIITRLEAKRRTAVIRHFSRTQECTDLKKNKTYTEQIKESITSISIQQWINNSCCANIAMNKCFLCKKMIDPLEKEMCTVISKQIDNVCKDIDVFTTPVTIEQHEKQICNYNKNYMSIKLEESKLKR